MESEKKEEYRQKIRKANSQTPCAWFEANNEDQILGQLYLGGIASFIQITSISSKLNKLSAHETAISLCDLKEIITDCALPKEVGEAASFRNEYIKPGSRWVYVGEGIGDRPEYWQVLVSNCTYVHQTRKELPDDVKKWFEPVFFEIDQAVFYNKKTLIHCRVGVSRSVAVVIAYLINRFDVTTIEAQTFVRSRRCCANTIFIDELRKYEADLKNARK